jgi:hypothetical protein
VATDQLAQQFGLCDPAIAMGQRFQQKFAALKIIG